MNTNSKPLTVTDNIVVSLEYDLTVDGDIVDSTSESDPITFLQGHREIIPGLERELYGMVVGDRKKVVVASNDAYGEVDPEAIVDVPQSEFPADFPLKPGVELQVRDMDGETMMATILSVGKETVKLDFNHPLAGKELHFEVTVVELRSATQLELAHGHVHDENDEEFDEDEDEDEEGDDFEENEFEDDDFEDDDFDDDDFDDDFDDDDFDDDFDDDYDDDDFDDD